jgi:hypothetical protein
VGVWGGRPSKPLGPRVPEVYEIAQQDVLSYIENLDILWYINSTQNPGIYHMEPLEVVRAKFDSGRDTKSAIHSIY